MKFLRFTFVFLIIILTTSCSNGNTPIATSDIQDDAMIVSELSGDRLDNPYRGVFGAWKVILDTENLSFEILPARNASVIGDIYDADLLQFLTVSPCANCLRITDMGFDKQMRFRMDVGLKHPFPNLSSRPDLHGFDVRLIFIMGSNDVTYSGINMMNPDASEEEVVINPVALINADGYTSHFDSIVTDERYFRSGEDVQGNINPFLRFFNDYGTAEFDPHSPSGHNVMPVGSVFETRTAVFGEPLYSPYPIYLVADVAYGHSATYENRPNPQYYLPSFNRTEPWRVEYWLENNGLNSCDMTSTADVVVQVFDWQHNAVVDPDYPDSSNLSGIRESSKVLQLELLVPGIQDAVVMEDTPESGTGTPTDPLQYRLTLTNENLLAYNTVGLLAVRDELYGQANPSGRMPVPEVPSGFPYDTEDILDYTLYEIIYINYPNWMDPYLGELNILNADRYFSSLHNEIYANFFMDFSGKKFLYEWDYDYDGVTFNVDGTGNPSPTIDFTRGGRFDLGLRVTTNSVPPRVYIYEIPVWIKGDVFQKDIDSTVQTKKDCSSLTRDDSIAMSSEYYYCAFTSEVGTKRDIRLNVGDKSGFFTSQTITGSMTQPCFFPSILTIEDGTHDRLLVLYNAYDGGKWDLYSIWGNLDGTGFEHSHVVKINTTRTYNSYVDIVMRYNRIFAYYWTANNPMTGQIEIAYSDDYGESWTVHPTLIDSGASGKWDPAVVNVTNTYRIHAIWTDTRNAATTGADLYMANSADGLNFGPSENLTAFSGLVSEIEPEADSYLHKIACVYRADSDGDTKNEIWLKYIDTSDNSTLDRKIEYAAIGLDCQKPSVGMAVDDKITIAYTAFNTTTNELRAIALELAEYGIFSFREETLYTGSAGVSIDPAVMNLYPGSAVQCRQVLNGEAVENFVVWTYFPDGALYRTDPFNLYLGDIYGIAKITDPTY